MENHPIPQDITGFQFKLIGNMTIKQFAYLAAGVIVAWIMYASPLFFIIKWPLILISAGLGVGTAFVPVEGRPMDVMIMNFFRALFSPTQFVYQKNGGHLWFPDVTKKEVTERAQSAAATLSGKRLQTYLQQLPQRSQGKLDDKEMAFFQSLASAHPVATVTATQAPAIPMPTTTPSPMLINSPSLPVQVDSPVIISVNPIHNSSEKPDAKEENKPDTHSETTLLAQDEEEKKALEQQSQMLSHELTDAEQKEKTATDQITKLSEKNTVITIETQLETILKQKALLEKEISELRGKLHLPPPERSTAPSVTDTSILSAAPAAPNAPTPTYNVVHVTAPAAPVAGTATAVLPPKMRSSGLPMPEFPNLVTGIVKDPRGNPLANILVEIKDQDGNPVRAFKTNGLGQFASATPLVTGSYTIDFEDPRKQNKFESVQFTTTGEIVVPFEIISMDTREELRRTLFNA